MRCGLVIFLLAIAAGAASAAENLKPGNYEFSIEFGGVERSYLVHMPRMVRSEPAPVVINFHGGGGNAKAQEKYSGMDVTADQRSFIAVYPNGAGRFNNRLLTWNAGTCCAYSVLHQVDDVGFTLAMLDDLNSRTPIDRSRIYATGLSNGAMMAYRLANDASDKIAAIAPIAGGMVTLAFNPTRPMPIMHIHSVDDPRALYHGGLGPPFPFTKKQVLHPDVEQMLARWRTFDQCPAEAKVTANLSGGAGTPDDGNTATEYVWAPCAQNTEIVFWKLGGSGHVWPGGERNYFPKLLGKGTGLINANEQIWNFFSQYSLPTTGAAAR